MGAPVKPAHDKSRLVGHRHFSTGSAQPDSHAPDRTMTSADRHGEPGPPARRWGYDTVCALAFVALGIGLFVLTPYQVARPLMMFGQMASGLQPERFPQLVAALLVGFGLWYLWQSRSAREPSGFASAPPGGPVRVLITLGVLLLYALLMERIGFVPASFLVALGLSWSLGQRNWALGIVVCLGVPVAVYWLFTRVLHVSLPPAALLGVEI
jgi:putative tricarboxylic transport membrane protein